MEKEKISIEDMVGSVRIMVEEHIAAMSIDDLLKINPGLVCGISILIDGCSNNGKQALYNWDKYRLSQHA